jgi:hypothetical protein
LFLEKKEGYIKKNKEKDDACIYIYIYIYIGFLIFTRSPQPYIQTDSLSFSPTLSDSEQNHIWPTKGKRIGPQKST